MNTPSTPRRPAAHRKSAVALLMIAGGLATAMPVHAQVDPSIKPVTNQTGAKSEILPCFKTKTGALTPCFKTRNSPGAIAPCVKTKIGGLAPCVKTKAPAATPVGP